MHFTESFISVPILALYSTREITSNLSSAKMATKRFASRTESKFGTAMNARESENYLAISRSSSASKSVEIFWAEIYRGRLFFRAESSLIQSQTPDSFRIRYRTWFIRWIQNLKS